MLESGAGLNCILLARKWQSTAFMAYLKAHDLQGMRAEVSIGAGHVPDMRVHVLRCDLWGAVGHVGSRPPSSLICDFCVSARRLLIVLVPSIHPWSARTLARVLPHVALPDALACDMAQNAVVCLCGRGAVACPGPVRVSVDRW